MNIQHYCETTFTAYVFQRISPPSCTRYNFSDRKPVFENIRLHYAVEQLQKYVYIVFLQNSVLRTLTTAGCTRYRF